MAPKGSRCETGCPCGKHKRAKCEPGCTCWRHNPSPEMIAKLQSMADNRKGARSTDEHRRKISTALTGRLLSDDHRRKMATVNADPALLKQKAESRKALRQTAATHRQVHKRLVSDRGPASDYLCVDCSGTADAWSHDWRTWEDVAQDLRHAKRMTFSTNLDAYEPRCHPCHNRLDRNPRPWDVTL